MEELVYLSKQNDFDNLIYYYKGNTPPKTFVGFKGPLRFSNNIKEGNIALEKAEEEEEEEEEEEQKEFKSK